MLTSHGYVDTKIESAVNTWMKGLPQKIKIEVFPNSNETITKVRQTFLPNGVSVLRLPGASDWFFPHQKKNFLVLNHVHDMHSEK